MSLTADTVSYSAYIANVTAYVFSGQIGLLLGGAWLHYDETTDAVLCHLCTKAVREKKMKPGNADVAELPGDSVAQFFRAWQAIRQVVGSSPSLRDCQFLFPLYFFPSH